MLAGCAGNLVAVVPGGALGQVGPDMALREAAFVFEVESQSCLDAKADKTWHERVQAARKILELPLRESCRETGDRQGGTSVILRYGGKVVLDRTDDGRLARDDRPLLLSGGDRGLLALAMPRTFRDRLLRWADGAPGFQFPAPFGVTLLIHVEAGQTFRARPVGIEEISLDVSPASFGLARFGSGRDKNRDSGQEDMTWNAPGPVHEFGPGYTAISVSPVVIWRALRHPDVPVPILDYPPVPENPDKNAVTGEGS
jgi:hypothetical protein